MSLFDAEDLIRLAGRIEDQASALRSRSRSMAGAARQARWHSTAAETFRGEVARLDRRVQHAAHNLDRAAHELRAHAGRVRAVQSVLAATARLEQAALAEAGHVVGAAARSTLRTGAEAAQTVGHAGRWLEDRL